MLTIVTTVTFGGLSAFWSLVLAWALWDRADPSLHVASHSTLLPLIAAAGTLGSIVCLVVALWAGAQRSRRPWAVGAWVVALGLLIALYVHGHLESTRTLVYRTSLAERCALGECPPTLGLAEARANSKCGQSVVSAAVTECGPLTGVVLSGVDGGDAYYYDTRTRELRGTRSWAALGRLAVHGSGDVPEPPSCRVVRQLCERGKPIASTAASIELDTAHSAPRPSQSIEPPLPPASASAAGPAASAQQSAPLDPELKRCCRWFDPYNTGDIVSGPMRYAGVEQKCLALYRKGMTLAEAEPQIRKWARAGVPGVCQLSWVEKHRKPNP